jgi:hypothetical protein
MSKSIEILTSVGSLVGCGLVLLDCTSFCAMKYFSFVSKKI